jgi:hypothetical protein
MAKKTSIKDLFRTLNINKSDYPTYKNPEQFGSSIKKCSLLKSHVTKYSNTSATQKAENK